MNTEIKNIEIKTITKIGTEYNNKKFVLTQNHQKLYSKEDEIEIKKIKMKKFSSTNNNFKLSKEKDKDKTKIIFNSKSKYRQNTFNKFKNNKIKIQNKIYKQKNGQKSTIITPQEINKEITIPNAFSHKKQNNINMNINRLTNSRKKEDKKISKNLSRENIYINPNNINNTFNNFLLSGTQRKKISFKDFEGKQKSNKILKLYNNNNNIYNDEITLINNTNINDVQTTNYTTKNNKNSGKNILIGSGNKLKKNKKLKLINKYKNNIEHFILNPSMKIDTNYINNMETSIINNNINKLDIRSGEKKIKNNNMDLTGNYSKKNVIKNIKDIIIENSNKNNVNLIHSFKSEVNIHNTGNNYNTNESKKKNSKIKDFKSKIHNLKISQRGIKNCNEFNVETNNSSCKNNKNKLYNKVIKLKDVNKNFIHIINNGMKFNSTVKNSSNKNVYITYINNTSASNNKNINQKKSNNNFYNNFYINKSNSNLISNSNLSKEKINHRNSLIKLNTLQNEDDVKKRLKHINYKSKMDLSPPKIPFMKDGNKLHMKIRHPYSNKHKNNPNEKINFSPKVNSIPKYVKTESNIANINIMNNNNIFINKLDFLENYAISSRKDNIFSKINNYILKGNNSKNTIINLLNRRKLSSKMANISRGNSLIKVIDSKEKEKETNLNKKRLRKIEYNNDTINNTNNKNSLFNYGAKTTKNLYKKDLILNKKYSFINVLKPKTINKLKRYTHNKTKEEKKENRTLLNSLKKEEKRKDIIIQDNSKLSTNNNKSLTFIYKEKKKNISSLLKQKNMIKLIQMIEELNLNTSKIKSKSKSKKKNKSSQHINFMATSSKKVPKSENIKFTEDKNIIENVIQNNMTMYSIYILSKYKNNFSKIGIERIELYDKNNKEIFILYSNSNSNTENKEDNTNYLFNEKNRPFITEFKNNLYINFFISVKKAENLKNIKIFNYENKNEEISAIKEIKIYHEKKKIFNGILSINCENIINISDNEKNKNNSSEQNLNNNFIITKKRGNSASNPSNKTNIYNINYINYKKNNNNTRSYSTFRQNPEKKINKIPKKQIVKIKSERNISPKEPFIKISNMYNNTEINEDTHYDNNNIIIYNICNTIPYNNYNDSDLKDEIYIRERFISDNDLEKSNNLLLNSNEAKIVHEAINLNKFNISNYNEESKNNTIPIENNFNLNSNYIKFKIIRMVLSSNYGHSNSIGLTGLEFYDINNKLINIETAETIGALPKDLHTIFNDPNDNRIFENIFNGENNTDDSFNMWLTLFDYKNNEKTLPYIELSFNDIIYLSKIKFFNYNQINQLDKCLKTIDIYLDNKFYGKINLRQGLGISINENIIQKENNKINNNDNNNINNDYSQDIFFPLNNDYYEKIYKNKNNYENIMYNEEQGLNVDFASDKYEQCYETPFMPNGYIIRFQLVNNFNQGKCVDNNNNKNAMFNIYNISLRNNNYIGINICNIYDQNGIDLLSQKEIKYKIVSNKEIIILDKNKYILYYTSNDDNNNLFFLFDTPINISYIELKPFSFLDKEENIFNSVKDIKIFCDINIIFEGQLYQFQPSTILFTHDNQILKNINTNYLTKYQLNREYTEIKTDNYYSMTFT